MNLHNLIDKTSYVKGTLSENEEIKEIVKLHWLNYSGTFLLGLITLLSVMMCFMGGRILDNLMIVLLFIILTIYRFLTFWLTEMVITNKRIIYKRGIFSIKTKELENAKVESVLLEQSVLGRIFGYGSICFSGTGASKVKFEKINDPLVTKSQIESVIRN